MGVSGSVAYMFDHTATFGVEGKSADDVLETLMEQDVDVRDVIEEDGLTIVYAEPDQFAQVQEALRQSGVKTLKLQSLKCYLRLILNFQQMIKQHLKTY